MTAVQPINSEATSLAEQAKSLVVVDNTSCEYAGEMLLTIASMRKRVADHHADVIAKAHAAHKAAIAARDSVDKPLELAERELRGKVSGYVALVRRRQEEERRAAEEQARREREAEIEAAAEQAEAEGASAQEVAAIIQHAEMAPLVAPVPVVQAPQMQGVSTREKWEARVTNPHQFFAAAAQRSEWQVFFKIDFAALNKWAALTKGNAQIPGVQVYRADSIAVRRIG